MYIDYDKANAFAVLKKIAFLVIRVIKFARYILV